MDCCGNEVRSESIYNMLQALVDSKVVNVQLLSIAVGIFFVVLLLKKNFRSFSVLLAPGRCFSAADYVG